MILVIYRWLHLFILARYRFTTCEDRKGRDMKKLRNCMQLSDWQKCLCWSQFKHETWKLISFHPFHGLCMLVAECHQSSSYKHHQRPLPRRLNRLGILACHEAVVGEAAEGTRLSPHSVRHVPAQSCSTCHSHAFPLFAIDPKSRLTGQRLLLYPFFHSSVLVFFLYILVFLCLWDSTERMDVYD